MYALTEYYIFIESWENKGKFPPSLKPALAKIAILAIRLDEYDDDFFSLMPMLFPYNKFTMTVSPPLSPVMCDTGLRPGANRN